MKRMKLKLKKGMAKFLTAITVMGLLPMMPSNMATVHAAEPSTTAYATKEQLKTWDYANTTGKIVFGKESSGNPMQWYILGSDSGVNGDNTAIFAASPIATNVMFEDDYANNKIYQESFGTYQNNTPTEVYPNHYGASDLRATLNEMASSNSYFTDTEQSLLLATSVTTADILNSASYTTTDVLYALHGDYNSNNDTTLYAGSNNGKALAVSTYWDTGKWFWLRAPYDGNFRSALAANPGSCVYDINVVSDDGVQPASNLNLSSVIFASAAPAASSDTVEAGTIQTGTAMTLRLDGSNMNIGNVIYDSARGDMIFVKKSANATGTVSLVVQGNDGSNDWYYSKTVTAGEVIRMADIKTALSLSNDISVDECEIWLETTVDGVAYAKLMENGIYTCIGEVTVTVDAPTLGEALASGITVQNTGVVSIASATKWTVGTTEVTGTADYDTVYTVTMNFTTGDREYFDDTLTATVNGETATITKNTDGTVTVSYTFPVTEKEKDKLISITQPQRLTVANKTAYEDMNLPTTVAIETDKGNVTQVAVIWNTTAPIDGSYDPAVLTEQTVTLAGTVTCPDSVDANGVTLETKILITISAAGVTGAPAANPVAGTYTENQSVSLSTTTEGATIYYTTDGTEPSKTNGTVYTQPISVTGTKGQSVTITIKAIAVKDGMQDSAVQTFTYTINLPADSEPGTVPPTPQPEDNNPEPSPNEDDTTTEDGKDEVPKTGDTSSPMISFMLMLASASCCMLLLMTNGRMGKKHAKNKNEQ